MDINQYLNRIKGLKLGVHFQNKRMSLALMGLSALVLIVIFIGWVLLGKIGGSPLFSSVRVIFTIINATLIPLMGYFVISLIGGLILFGIE
jgi:hypothetical protein